MKIIVSLFKLLILVVMVSCSHTEIISQNAYSENEKDIKIFFLAGQSNMEGRARALNLTNEDNIRLEKAKRNVTLYYNHQAPVPLQVTTPPKHVAIKFEAEQLFGPELFFGINMSEKYPDCEIVLIKRSKGGMSLYGAWNPDWDEEKAKQMNELDDPELYYDFIDYSKSILINYDKSEYEICGMLWVQGETDSGKRFGPEPANAYEENLKKLISGVRKEFNAANLPFIIFQVGNGKVVEGMKNIAKYDENVSLIPQSHDIDSEYYFVRNPSPIGHYKYESMKKIGEYFFKYYQKDYVK